MSYDPYDPEDRRREEQDRKDEEALHEEQRVDRLVEKSDFPDGLSLAAVAQLARRYGLSTTSAPEATEPRFAASGRPYRCRVCGRGSASTSGMEKARGFVGLYCDSGHPKTRMDRLVWAVKRRRSR